jgi:uncharacterized protein (DUF2461 family)
MAVQVDWLAWLLAIAVGVLFIGYFWWTGGAIVSSFRRLLQFIENWPQTQRAMVDAEARSGGRYPLWLRLARVAVLLALVALVTIILWRRFG